MTCGSLGIFKIMVKNCACVIGKTLRKIEIVNGLKNLQTHWKFKKKLNGKNCIAAIRNEKKENKKTWASLRSETKK